MREGSSRTPPQRPACQAARPQVLTKVQEVERGEMGGGVPDFTAAVTARLGTTRVTQQPRQQQGAGDPGLLGPF